MNTIPQDTPLKQCTKCKQYKPATSDFFPREKRKKDGFNCFCKVCINEYQKKLRKEGPTKEVSLPDGYKRCNKCEKLLPATAEYFFRDRYTSDGFVPYCKEHTKRHRKGAVINGMKVCPRCKRNLPATSEYFHARKERKSGLRSKCKVCESEIEAKRQRPKASKEKNHQRYLTEREYRLRQRYAHYWSHREKYLLYDRQRNQKRPHQLSAYRQKRRAIVKAAPGTHTANDIKRQYERQKGRCYYCSKKFGQGKRAYHVDHIVPLSRKGSNDPSNLVITCPACNLSKSDKFLHEWTQGGRLL